MYYFDGIIVVEGSGDASYLSSFIDSEYVITNGYDLPHDTVEYLSRASRKKQIIILTDPDKAGLEIRQKLHSLISGIDVEVDLNKCNKHGKHGVAECLKEEVVEKLSKFLKEKNVKNEAELINEAFLYSLNVSNKEFYLFIQKKFCLGSSNRKTMIRRLNTLGISRDELINAVEEYNRGN